MFKAELIGNLGADAEVKSAEGAKFITMRIADTQSWTDQSGAKHSTTNWVDAIINNADSKVLPFLKQGTKVMVRGNISTRVYSSPKDRMMKAGITIHVQEIELIGAQPDPVPRQLIDPDGGIVLDVTKHYWVGRDNKKMGKDDAYTLVDSRGREFIMNKAGFVTPKQNESVQD